MSEVVEFPSQNTLAAVVAANIRAEAARRGVKQVDLAALLGVAQSRISDRWRGRTEWSLTELETVSRYFGMTVSSLVVRPEGFEPPTF